jgi:hypothetical protein
MPPLQGNQRIRKKNVLQSVASCSFIILALSFFLFLSLSFFLSIWWAAELPPISTWFKSSCCYARRFTTKTSFRLMRG